MIESDARLGTEDDHDSDYDISVISDVLRSDLISSVNIAAIALACDLRTTYGLSEMLRDARRRGSEQLKVVNRWAPSINQAVIGCAQATRTIWCMN